MQNQTQESMFTEMSDDQAATYNGGWSLWGWLTGSHPYIGPAFGTLLTGVIGKIFK